MDKWRTPEAAEYRKLYGTKPWRQLREQALLRDAFTCQRCKCILKRGSDKNSVTAAVDAFAGAMASVPVPQGVELRSDEEQLIWEQFTRARAPWRNEK